MKMPLDEKVDLQHLQRNALLYVRQSTLRQVAENTESTQRQYALRQRAFALGWPDERIIVIDQDLGQSGASAVDREGFQHLVTEVGMGRAGVVMGLEVSRLARNSSDWHRLLEMCAVSNTLILDEEGLYDPSHFNDRLLLGLKGTMSEAELHLIRARLRGGMLSKARRGELRFRLPVGFVYDPKGQVILDPDVQVRHSVQLLFDTFERTGSAYRTVKAFREQGLTFPARMHFGPSKGEIVWRSLNASRVNEALHNPRYAGAYCYGRRSQRRAGIDAPLRMETLPREQWHTLIVDAHEGYISWQQYENNLEVLAANALGRRKLKCPPREGPALLQGLAVCAQCGGRMTVRYHHRRGRLSPDYVCGGAGKPYALPTCQSIPGEGIDEAIGEVLLEAITPLALEVALAVQDEVQTRIEQADQLRYQQVERARYEVELARRRYMQVDPDNRLVADSLEAEWNQKLRQLAQAQQEYDHHRENDRLQLDESMRSQILTLAKSLPTLWRNPDTPQLERKRMVRLMIEDVTLLKQEDIALHIRFKGGATQSLTVPKPLSAWEERKTSPEVLAEIDRLLDHHTDAEIATILNQRRLLSGCGKTFDGYRVRRLRRRCGLKCRFTRLREQGWLTLTEVAHALGVNPWTVKVRRAKGTLGLDARKLNDAGQYLYENPKTPGFEQPSQSSACTQEA